MTTPLAQQARRTDGVTYGILSLCLALFFFVIMNSMVKALTEHYPVPEIVWARYVAQFLLMVAIMPHRIPRLLASPRKDIQILRGCLLLGATACTISGLHFLPLADVVALTFISPFVVTVLAALLLGEKVGPRRWIAVAIGFIGMLAIIRPGSTVFQLGALFPIGMAFFLGAYIIATRMISHIADPMSSLFYACLVGTIGATLPLPFFWVTPDPWHLAMMLGAGLFGGIGHFLMIKAYERTEASAIAPFAYTELIWAAAFGLVVFGNFPDLWTWVGAAIITASGLYIAHRERVVRNRTATATTAPRADG